MQRVEVFPSLQFVLMNVDELPSEQQEIIFNFISRPERADSFNLHCVQLSDTILHASPWVEKKLWRNDRQNIAENLQNWITGNVLDGSTFDRISVVSSSSCGTGKTQYIDEEIVKIKSNDRKAQIYRISIHEKSSLETLVSTMIKNFDAPSQNNTLYLSFMIPLVPKHKKVLDMLNYFFQSFFLTKSVRDPQSEVTFHLGTGKWNVFVELEVSSDLSSASAERSVSKYIPILGYCSSFESPSHLYLIDEKARRVCTYLRAFNNGTIDRKFQPASKKQLLFVIDKSGSMEQSMGNNKTALDVAVDNAVSIFDSHAQIDDVSTSYNKKPCVTFLWY